MVPEGNATNTNFKKTSNTQSLAGANRAVIRTMHFFSNCIVYWMGKSHMYYLKNNSVRKIVSNKLFKTLVSALPSGIVWVNVLSPSVVSGVANREIGEDKFPASVLVKLPVLEAQSYGWRCNIAQNIAWNFCDWCGTWNWGRCVHAVLHIKVNWHCNTACNNFIDCHTVRFLCSG